MSLMPLKFFALATLFCYSCNNAEPSKPDSLHGEITSTDSIVFSFAFMGCNRVDHADKHESDTTYHSTANVAALDKSVADMINLAVRPSVFFLLGDIVLGEKDTSILNKELNGWKNLFKNNYAVPLRNAGIEVIAIPGNHEMLFNKNPEVTLKGSSQVWMNYMASFMPSDRTEAPNDSLDNRMTFAFKRKNTGFIVINTDSYNHSPGNNKEGQIPINWITNHIQAYRADTSIKNLFVLGHKPFFVACDSSTGHMGLPDGTPLWNAMRSSKVIAMLTAHKHDYQRFQPDKNGGPYQVIAGNGGSPLDGCDFFGYTIIQIMSTGNARLISRGYKSGNPYYSKKESGPFLTVDSTILTWSKNPDIYLNYSCK